jgi:acetyl esterase
MPNAPMLSTADMVYYDEMRASGSPPTGRPHLHPACRDRVSPICRQQWFLPLNAIRWQAMAPYCERITGRRQGHLLRGPGWSTAICAHAIQPVAPETVSRMVAAISALGAGEWPY